MRRPIVLGLVSLMAWAAACDSIEREAPPRYYIPPDAESPVVSSEDSGGVSEDADASDLDVEAGTDGAPPSTFNPATLMLSAWWRAPYAAAAWVGVPSLGTSATRNLAEATNPPAVGAPVNNLVSADFDGTKQILANPSPISGIVSATAWSAVLLVYVDAVSTSSSPGLLEIVSDTGGYWDLGTWNNPTPKVAAAQFDGAQKVVDTPITLGAWSLVQARFDGAMLMIRVNGGAWASSTANAIQVTTGTLNVGVNYTKTLFFNGQILELMLSPLALPDAAFEGIRGYAMTRYGLTL